MPDRHYTTGMQIRCPNCHRYFGAPDIESVHTYAAQGGIIQTLTERVITEVIHKHYVTPGPLWKAAAFTMIPLALGPAEVLYFGVDPVIAFGLVGVGAGIGLVIASTEVEKREIPDKLQDDDEPEPAQVKSPMPFEQVTRPGPNSMSIRRVHEPPRDDDPKRQISLARADIALAKLVTASAYPMEPISWSEAQRRQWGSNGFRYGEKTFYQIQRKWLDEGIAFSASGGAVYLKPSGRKILTQYANQ